jgi:ribosomal protein L32
MLITVYCFVDEFVKMVTQSPIGEQIVGLWKGKRGPERKLSLAETMTLNIMRFYLKMIDLKAFHSLLQNAYQQYFPNLPNYENFLKATNKSYPYVLVFLNYLLFLNRKNNRKATFFMDATALSVCDNHYIYSHRVTQDFASRGKTTKGWFYGFKLHGTCDEEGNLLNICFTTGSVHDSQLAENITGGLEGTFVADAGYILKESTLQSLYEKHRRILAAARKNMKRVMSQEQKQLFRKRSIIETVWDVLKERFELVYHLARGMTGLFRHYLYSLVAFMLKSILNNPPLPCLMPLLLS